MSFSHNQRKKKRWRENQKVKTTRVYSYLQNETFVRYKEGK